MDHTLRRFMEAGREFEMSTPQARKTISIVTPCFNEESGIEECARAIEVLFKSDLPGYDYEHIFCDNASSDGTVEILKRLATGNASIKIIVNSRNFGILKNTYNGVCAASGDAVLLFLPADLQDPPSLIPEFVRLWEQGYEIVYGLRAQREENWLMRNARKLYYRFLSAITYVDYPADAGDFQLVDRKVHNAMMRIDDAQPFMRMMTFESGFRSIGVKYKWGARKHGKSRNHWSHLFDQGMNGIISFSGAPLRVALLAGLGIAALSVVYSFVVVALVLSGRIHTIAGIPTLIAALFFFGGAQLFFVGLLGEYILAIFNQVRRKPLVVERERINFDGGR
jgi:glycosyltransferase involved in cell wall biosynthesis